MKPLRDIKKSLENEKNTWLAEKTALKSEVSCLVLSNLGFNDVLDSY